MIIKKLGKLKKDNFWRTLSKNSFLAFFGDSGAALINLLIIAILIRLIGSDNYGVLVLAQSYASIMDTVLNIQSWKGVIQYGHKALAQKNINNFYGYVKAGCLLDIGTAIMGGILSIAFAGLIGFIFQWNNELILCAQIFSIAIFSHFAGTPTALLRIFNKFNLVAIQKITAAIIKFGVLASCLIFLQHIDLILTAIIYVVTDIIGNLLLIIFAIHVFRRKYHVRVMLKSKFATDNKQFLKFTLWGSITDMVDVPIHYFDVFIVSLLNTEAVAIYKVFQQITSVLSKLTSALYQAILPQFSELSAKNLKRRGYEIVLKIRNFILVFLGAFSLVLGFTSPFWLKFFFGEIYAANWPVLCCFLLTQAILLSYFAIHPYFISLDKNKASALYVLVANIIYVVVAFSTIHIGGLYALVFCNFLQGIIVIYLKTIHIKKYLRKERA